MQTIFLAATQTFLRDNYFAFAKVATDAARNILFQSRIARPSSVHRPHWPDSKKKDRNGTIFQRVAPSLFLFLLFFFFLPPGSAVFNRGINQPEYGRWSWSWSTASAIDRGLSTPNKDISLRDTKSVRFSRLLLAFTSYPRTFLVSSYVSCRHSLAIWNSFFVHNDPSLGRKIKGSRKWNQRDSREKTRVLVFGFDEIILFRRVLDIRQREKVSTTGEDLCSPSLSTNDVLQNRERLLGTDYWDRNHGVENICDRDGDATLNDVIFAADYSLPSREFRTVRRILFRRFRRIIYGLIRMTGRRSFRTNERADIAIEIFVIKKIRYVRS